MTKKGEPTFGNPFEAFRFVVYRYGVEKLAPLVGMKPGTLWNKADADDSSHNQPTLRDVVRITSATGDMAVIDALNQLFERAAFDVRPHTNTSDAALLELLTRLGMEKGRFHGALHHALVDGKFTRDELRLIRGTAFDLISALMTTLARVEGLVDE